MGLQVYMFTPSQRFRYIGGAQLRGVKDITVYEDKRTTNQGGPGVTALVLVSSEVDGVVVLSVNVRGKIPHNPISFPTYLPEGTPNATRTTQDGQWGEWPENWGTCSVTCGGGSQFRTRLCNKPAPANDGAPCIGQSTQYQRCNEEVLCDWSEINCSSGSKVKGFRFHSKKQSSAFNQIELICENDGAITRVKTTGVGGEDICQYENPDRTNKAHCLTIGCCHFNEDPEDVEGFGKCWSNVGNGPCHGTQGWTEDKTCSTGLAKELSILGSSILFTNLKMVCEDDSEIVAVEGSNWTGSDWTGSDWTGSTVLSCSTGICGIKFVAETTKMQPTCC